MAISFFNFFFEKWGILVSMYKPGEWAGIWGNIERYVAVKNVSN